MVPDVYFADRVDVLADGCWLWLRHKDRQGYGRAARKGASSTLAHRISYESHIGPIPEGLTIDHSCFNPSCVNPQHLTPMPRSENSARQRAALGTHCGRGHEFTPDNTYFRTKREDGIRNCRRCNAEAVARYKSRRTA